MLEAHPQVLRAGLAGDHLRAIVEKGLDEQSLQPALEAAGVTVQSIQAGEPGLEDVFIHLAKQRL